MSTDKSLGPWLKMDYWSVREAAYLLSSVTPRDEDALKSDMHGEGPVAQLYRALKDATIAKSIWYWEVDGVLMRRRVRPSDAVAWAKKRGMSVPGVLAQLKPAGTQSKLTSDQKADIAKRLKQGDTVAGLAREFSVSRRTIDKCKPKKAAQQPANWTGPITRHK